MNLPSTEELQRLLDETPDETWRAELDEGEGWWNVVPAYCGGSHTPIAEGMSQPVAELTAESRALAAEVIRLGKENERLTRIEWLAEQAAESDSGLAYDLDQINQEYEGDQA